MIEPIDIYDAARAAVAGRAKFKSVFDAADDDEQLHRSLRIAHEQLASNGHYEAVQKLLEFQKHYFPDTLYVYSSDDVKDAVVHCISVITKHGDNMTVALEKKESIKGYLRFIHNSTAALARKIAKLSDDPEVIRSDFNTAIHYINQAVMNYHYVIKNAIDRAIGKVTATLGIVTASIDLDSVTPRAKKISGVNPEIEIKRILKVIGHALSELDVKEGVLHPIQKAHISRTITAARKRLVHIENLETRYNYLSVIKTAILKYIKGTPDDVYAYISAHADTLKDERATAFRKAKYQAKVINRNNTDNSKTFLALTKEQADILLEQAETQMIQQSEPSRYQSWAKLACAISLLTGRRIYEVCITGEFEVVNAHTMKMKGVAKQKNEDDRESKEQTFFVYANAFLIEKAIAALRKTKAIDNIISSTDAETYGYDYNTFKKSCNTALRRAMNPDKPSSKPFFDADFIEIKLLPKSMRQLYAALYRYKLRIENPDKSDNFYDQKLAENLGHNSETDMLTVQSYKDIVIKNS